ncbi:CotY/CotZ family spore coat protein [Neobacillus niacini]|uniref:CotY/CotZ family spore coat protein n=1 Tax=Neobacillus niacini TaxID=86668 RepID=UPI001C8E1BF1|nr:CotY/CotZ family spore coat protein [Neobacillus niacini]MBY0144773.1 spore coat protein CotZ [Neobacillus niacini]
MGCGRNSDVRSTSGCVCDVVRAIKDIQDNAVQDDDCLDCPSCFLEPLGTLVSPARDRADTRVFVLKNADGSPFHAFFMPTNGACVSIYFRVEEVFDNCCATLRVLEPGNRTNGGFSPVDLVGGGEVCCINLERVCQVNAFRSTNDCITVDLNCFCAIQCIADVDLGICD